MQAGRRYSLFQTLNWGRNSIMAFTAWSTVPVVLHEVLGWTSLKIPWVPITLIGTAVAFYLGFKNNSSYERLWEARKIWGGIVNTSRSWAVTVRDFVTNEFTDEARSQAQLEATVRRLVFRHLAWVHALALQLRERRPWEHSSAAVDEFRRTLGTLVTPESYDTLLGFLDRKDFDFVRSKKNTAVHILGLQSEALRELRHEGLIDDFRHMELQKLVVELYALQGKSERIKNYPFPRQYATVNLFFVVLFILLLPFGLVPLFADLGGSFIWVSIPFSVMVSWVFFTMEMIGDYSENPFEGTYNDVPITTMATGIEIDLRELIGDSDLPEPIAPLGEMKISV